MSDTQWFVYIIRCRQGQLYTGSTTDINRRFSEHQKGGAKGAKFLRGKGPLELVYHERAGHRADALKREMAIKKLTRDKKIALIATFDENRVVNL